MENAGVTFLSSKHRRSTAIGLAVLSASLMANFYLSSKLLHRTTAPEPGKPHQIVTVTEKYQEVGANPDKVDAAQKHTAEREGWTYLSAGIVSVTRGFGSRCVVISASGVPSLQADKLEALGLNKETVETINSELDAAYKETIHTSKKIYLYLLSMTLTNCTTLSDPH